MYNPSAAAVWGYGYKTRTYVDHWKIPTAGLKVCNWGLTVRNCIICIMALKRSLNVYVHVCTETMLSGVECSISVMNGLTTCAWSNMNIGSWTMQLLYRLNTFAWWLGYAQLVAHVTLQFGVHFIAIFQCVYAWSAFVAVVECCTMRASPYRCMSYKNFTFQLASVYILSILYCGVISLQPCSDFSPNSEDEKIMQQGLWDDVRQPSIQNK